MNSSVGFGWHPACGWNESAFVPSWPGWGHPGVTWTNDGWTGLVDYRRPLSSANYVQMVGPMGMQQPYSSAADWSQQGTLRTTWKPGHDSRGPRLDPEKEALVEQLGILPSEEPHFGWIAQYGLGEDTLPPGWTRHKDEISGSYYYVDHESQGSTWENPLLPHLRRVVEVGRQYLRHRSATFFDEQKVLLWHDHKEQLSCWHSVEDGEGRQCFVNSVTGESLWQDPREDMRFIFELENILLTSLKAFLPPAEGAEPQRLGGAEILSLEPRSRLRSVTERAAVCDHSSALQKMQLAASWLREICEVECEEQHLLLLRKAQERKQRMARRSGSPSWPAPPHGRARATTPDSSDDEFESLVRGYRKASDGLAQTEGTASFSSGTGRGVSRAGLDNSSSTSISRAPDDIGSESSSELG